MATEQLTFSELKEAIHQNDIAHRKTLVEDGMAGKLSRERFIEIEDEARMWLRHLFSIHRVTDVDSTKSLKPAHTERE